MGIHSRGRSCCFEESKEDCMKNVILAKLLCVTLGFSFAEGTKELRPAANNTANLHITDNAVYTDFAQYGAPPEHQIKIQIADLSERMYFGMNNKEGNGDDFVPNVPFRIVSPTGVIVYNGIMPGTGQEGFIDSWNEAVAGPQELGFAGGYNALEYQPTEIGDYVIEFDPPGDLDIHLFDMTVADASGQVQLGRLHSQGWQISTESFSNPFFGTMYPYEPSGTLYEVDFNQMQPYLFVVNFNSIGTGNTGDFFVDRQSKEGNHTTPEFEVFLNPPPEELYPTIAPDISFEAEITQIDCETIEMCLSFTANEAGYVEGFIDLNGNNVYDEDQGEVYFGEFIDQPGTRCIEWDGTDADGNPIAQNEIRMVSSFGFGVTHLPLYDVEHNRNGYIVRVARPSGVDDPLIFWDDGNLTEGSTLGDPLVNLEGCSSQFSGCHRWENRGSIFAGNSGDQETINTWWYSQMIYDTLIFNVTETRGVQLSYLADSLLRGDSVVCEGDELTFHVYNDGTTHFDTARYFYEWYYNGTSLSPDVGNQTKIVTQSSEIVVHAIDKNNTACQSYDTLNVSAQTPIQLNAVILDETCTDMGSINLNITDGPSNYEITWDEFPGNNSAFLNDLEGGEYNVYIADPQFLENCALDTSFTLEGANQIAIESLNVVDGDCFNPTGAAEIIMEDPNLDYAYTWNGIPDQVTSRENLGVGQYTITVQEVGTDCVLDTGFTISATSFDYNVLYDNEKCSSGSGFINIEVTDPGVTVNWNDGSNSFNRANLTSGIYSFELVNPNDPACTATQTINILIVESDMTADFTYESLLDFQVDEITDIVQFENLSSGDFTSWNWDFGDGNSSSDLDPQHSYGQVGFFTITLSIQDQYGCSDVVSQVLKIDEKPVCEAAIPTAFSPNDDFMNDDIGVLGDVQDFDLKVFNRWGEVIFRSQEIEKRWGGFYRQAPSPIGVYPFVLDYWCPDKKGEMVKNTKVGQITLVR